MTFSSSIFFDDVQLFSPSRRAHLRHIRILLTTLRWYRFYLGKSKSKWFAQSLLSLGALITDDGIAVDPFKWDKIANWPTPCNKKDILQFQGTINWMHDHLKDLASVMAPLTALTGSCEWQWGDPEEAAFAKVKSMVPVLLKLIDWEKVRSGEHKLYVFTDVSIAGIGAHINSGPDCTSSMPYRFYSAKFNLRRSTTIRPIKSSSQLSRPSSSSSSISSAGSSSLYRTTSLSRHFG
jgi:hypothetical protein